jgi:putative sulfotransferase
MGTGNDTGAVVLNTGRCGSTMLSDMFALHADVCSVQEFFVCIADKFDRHAHPGPWTGPDFWKAVSEPSDILRVLHKLDRLPSEFRYDLTNYPADKPLGMSGLLSITLPALTDDPDALFAELAELVPQFPTQRANEQCAQLFELLQAKTTGNRWIERTGGSSGSSATLLRLFPKSKIVYLTRDCVDTAYSMTRMPVAVLLYLDLLLSEGAGVTPYRHPGVDDLSDVPEELQYLLPDNLTQETLDRFARSTEYLEFTVAGLAMVDTATELAMSRVPAERKFRITYEEIMAAPQETLTRLGEFLELPDHADWAERASGMVEIRPKRSTKDDQLRRRLHGIYDRMRTDNSILVRASDGRPDWMTNWVTELSAAADADLGAQTVDA